MGKYVLYYIMGTALLSCSLSAYAAGPFDGSKPLLCAAIHATMCDEESVTCTSGAPWMVDFPVFTEIDFAAKTAATTRQHAVARTSKIDAVEHLPNNRMSVQGADDDYSWSMLISEETGSMTLAVAGEAVGFIVLGACTIR
jgi:hypothetical protein